MAVLRLQNFNCLPASKQKTMRSELRRFLDKCLSSLSGKNTQHTGFYINLEVKRDKMKKIILPLNKPRNKVTDFQ